MSSENSPAPVYTIGVFAALFLLTLAFQVSSGAWESDFGGHADEASHVVTSLMVRDYLAGGFLDQWRPMRYAENYYEQFPKVAIGNYPPGFYLLAGVFLLPLRSPEMLLLVMSGTCATAGLITWLFGRQLLGREMPALCVALLFCLLPLTRTYTAIVMSDLLLVIFCLLSVFSFARFLERGRWRDSIGFGVWASFAILTKGSGLCLAALPPVAILLSGRFSFLRNPRLLGAPLTVFLLAFPWMWLTKEITAEGMQTGSRFDYFREALPYYLKGIAQETGWGTLLIMAFMTVFYIPATRLSQRGGRGCIESTTLAFPICVLFLDLTIPAGLDHRYLLPLVPFALLTGAWCLEWISSRWWPKAQSWIVPLFCFCVVGETWRTVEKRYTGASEVISGIVSDEKALSETKRKNVLVVSNPAGEGALIAAAAFLGRDELHLQRGTKILATSDWLGRGYRVSFTNAPELAAILEKFSIQTLVVDSPDETARSAGNHWTMVSEILGEPGGMAVAELTGEYRSLRKHGVENTFSVYRVKSVPTELPQSGETAR
jgi:hypothetical protein